MDIASLIWLIILLSMLQPMVQQRMLEATRQRLIRKIERERQSRVILMIHRQETMSFFGFPIMRYITIEDAERVIRAIQLTDPDVPIDFVVHTPGGLVLASLQIARALARHKAPVRVIVPHYAMSGGTLIALAADEIVMGEHAVLGPVDPQIGQYPAASILKAVEKKDVNKLDDQTLILSDLSEKAIQQVRRAVFELLTAKGTLPEEKAEKLAEILSTGRWTHDYPISADEARALGLPVNTEVPHDFFELLTLYPQPIQQAPTVEYLPDRRRFTPPTGKP